MVHLRAVAAHLHNHLSYLHAYTWTATIVWMAVAWAFAATLPRSTAYPLAAATSIAATCAALACTGITPFNRTWWYTSRYVPTGAAVRRVRRSGQRHLVAVANSAYTHPVVLAAIEERLPELRLSNEAVFHLRFALLRHPNISADTIRRLAVTATHRALLNEIITSPRADEATKTVAALRLPVG